MANRWLKVSTFALIGAISPAVSGAVVVSLNNAGSTTLHEIEVRPGESFATHINVNITGQERVGWLSTYLQASFNGIFDIAGGAYMEDPGEMFVFPPFPTDGVNSVPVRFGFMMPSTSLVGPYSFSLAHVNLSVDAKAGLGTHTLSISDVWFNESPWTTVEPFRGESGPDFVVRVIPEPASFLLMCAALGLVIRRTR